MDSDATFRLVIVAIAAVSMLANFICFALVLHKRIASIRLFQAGVALYIGCFYGAILFGKIQQTSELAITLVRSSLVLLLVAATLEALLQTRLRKGERRRDG